MNKAKDMLKRWWLFSLLILILAFFITGVFFINISAFKQLNSSFTNQQNQLRQRFTTATKSTGWAVIKIKDSQLQVELADTPVKRTQGLSRRPFLADDQGMLFLFDRPGYYSFWMKEMNFPIDIIWLAPDWRIVDITPRLSPATFPQIFQPRQPAQYVLEVTAGSAARRRFKLGDKVEFIPQHPAEPTTATTTGL